MRRGWKIDLIENSRSAQSSSVFIIERFYCDCVFCTKVINSLGVVQQGPSHHISYCLSALIPIDHFSPPLVWVRVCKYICTLFQMLNGEVKVFNSSKLGSNPGTDWIRHFDGVVSWKNALDSCSIGGWYLQQSSANKLDQDVTGTCSKHTSKAENNSIHTPLSLSNSVYRKGLIFAQQNLQNLGNPEKLTKAGEGMEGIL